MMFPKVPVYSSHFTVTSVPYCMCVRGFGLTVLFVLSALLQNMVYCLKSTNTRIPFFPLATRSCR